MLRINNHALVRSGPNASCVLLHGTTFRPVCSYKHKKMTSFNIRSVWFFSLSQNLLSFGGSGWRFLPMEYGKKVVDDI